MNPLVIMPLGDSSNPFGFTHQLALLVLLLLPLPRTPCLLLYFFEDGYEMVGIHWPVKIRAQLIITRYLKIHILHPLKSDHLDILTQTHTTFFDPLLAILRFSGLELIHDHSGGLHTFFRFFLQVSKLLHGDATFWKMRPNVS